ncbi:MAG: RagB/SusD family nutrient uptake outer membrane protein [Bacteroidales bacterium]
MRRVNVMLDNIDDSEMSDSDKAHWRSVGYFFRSYYYYDLLTYFGDLPWVEHSLQTSDKEFIYGKRLDRNVVADSIFNDLLWAEKKINKNGSGPNTINTDVVRALISRIGLFEGTYRKYHNLGSGETFLQESKRVSEILVNKYPNLMTNYYDEFVSEDLVGRPGMLLVAEYNAYMGHGRPRIEATSSHYVEMCGDAFDSYLCQDGQTIENSSIYSGDAHIYDMFRNRDYRLYFTVCPPFQVKKDNPQSREWEYTANAFEREYIDLMDSISGDAKTLPMMNWNDFVVFGMPHFRSDNRGQPYCAVRAGYYFWKFYTKDRNQNFNGLSLQTTDRALFRMSEVMLNLAEASYELDASISQEMADKTINKLRDRGHVSHLEVNSITPDNSSRRDTEVSDLLWEIRRERRVELMGENYRFYDLRRWKKGHYINKEQTGCKITDTEVPFHKGVSVNSDGYACYFGDPLAKGLGWEDFMYLEPIPIQELELNKEIIQNDEWAEFVPK